MRRVVVLALLVACAGQEPSPAPPPPPSPAVSGAPDTTAAMEVAQQVARRYGRFGGVEDVSVAPDGRVMLVAVRDHPSTCLCDRERGVRDRGRGVALVEHAGELAPRVTYLLERHGSDHQVAASRDHLAVATSGELRVWPRSGEGEPARHRLPTYSVVELAWLRGGRWLVAVAPDQVIVLDATAGFAPLAAWRLR